MAITLWLSRHRLSAIALASSLTIGLIPLPLAGQEANTEPGATDAIDPANPADTAIDISNPRPILELGSQGAAVLELQALLKLLGYYSGDLDGRYQESTATAVSAFQQAAGLQPDGIVGTETWSRLLPAAPAITPTTAAAPAPVAPTTAAAPTAAPTAAPPAPPGNSPTPSPTPAPPVAPATPILTPSTTGTSPGTPPSAAPAPATPTPTAALPAEQPILRLGMEGAAVTQLQERLKAIGLFNGAVDGVFGTETELAVQEVQRRYNLEPDGIVGPATWAVLLGQN
ncbi:peptidoglycan-binding domain-containing protein [Leptolyngbya sp. NK1-12]|nr:peptidoglycan-binding domain-containing protein [Leptolyngbya sp. NK1-12]